VNQNATRTRLDSWKSIAEYLKRSPRTVQRWQESLVLPVHHFGGGKGPVFAYTDELDAWLSGLASDSVNEEGSANAASAARQRRSLQLAAQADAMWTVRSEENLTAIAALYRNAIDQDAESASAFIGLANSLVLASLVGLIQPSAAYPRAFEAVRCAHRLGFNAPEARCADAWLQLAHEHDWKLARAGFDEVLSRQPPSSHALAGRGLLHVVEGDLVSALQCLQDAWRQCTLAPLTNALLCWVYYLSGDYDLLFETVDQSRASGERSYLMNVLEAFAHMHTGAIASALEALEASAAANPQCKILAGALGYAYAISDQAGKAQEVLHSLKRTKGEGSYPQALVLSGLRDTSQALSCVRAALLEGNLWGLGLRFDPIFEPLRSDRRFAALLRKTNIAG
jgi:hypothetical protein